jgi:hypothetical protein
VISISLPRPCMLSSNWNRKKRKNFGFLQAQSRCRSSLLHKCETLVTPAAASFVRLQCVCVCITALGCHATMEDRTLRSRLMQALVHTGSRLQSDTREAQATSSLS